MHSTYRVNGKQMHSTYRVVRVVCERATITRQPDVSLATTASKRFLSYSPHLIAGSIAEAFHEVDVKGGSLVDGMGADRHTRERRTCSPTHEVTEDEHKNARTHTHMTDTDTGTDMHGHANPHPHHTYVD